jgi:hypothetical protein
MVDDQSTDILATIIKCVNFAAVKHKNQRRKDPEKTPYVNHVIGNKIMGQYNYENCENTGMFILGYGLLSE